MTATCKEYNSVKSFNISQIIMLLTAKLNNSITFIIIIIIIIIIIVNITIIIIVIIIVIIINIKIYIAHMPVGKINRQINSEAHKKFDLTNV